MKHIITTAIITTAIITCAAIMAQASEKPTGRFLFQPMFIWGTTEITQQGTGYLMKSGDKSYGVTSIHFLDFAANGLTEAVWLDINSELPVVKFQKGLGKPAVTAIKSYQDIQHDFLIMPVAEQPENCSYLSLDTPTKYQPGDKLWFPNKSPEAKIGYKWIDAEVIKDEGYMIKVRLLSKVKLESQSGTPFLNQNNGKVIGMLMGGDEKTLLLCPARALAEHIKKTNEALSLSSTIRAR